MACGFRFIGIFWKCARVGERLSPYISFCCAFMAVSYGGSYSSVSLHRLLSLVAD